MTYGKRNNIQIIINRRNGLFYVCKRQDTYFRMNGILSIISVALVYLTIHAGTTDSSVISNPTVLQGKTLYSLLYTYIHNI